MKIHLLTILIMASIPSCNSKQEKINNSYSLNELPIEELEKKGFEAYQNNPLSAIPIFKLVANEYQKTTNSKKAGITFLNIANIFDEHQNQLDSAIIYSEKSLKIWLQENDSLQFANLYKYIGLLKGKQGKFDEAKSYIHEAIKTYNTLEFDHGVAVSEINLADTYYREKEYEKSILYFKKAKEFWVLNNDLGRIYTNNVLGIKILNALGKNEEVNSLIEENLKIEEETNINNFVKSKFDELLALQQ